MGAGSVVNEAQFGYNDFAQVATDYQEHGGTVNVATSPKVQSGYADGGSNTIRPTSLTYPDGRVLSYDYGSSGGAGDALSRVAALPRWSTMTAARPIWPIIHIWATTALSRWITPSRI